MGAAINVRDQEDIRGLRSIEGHELPSKNEIFTIGPNGAGRRRRLNTQDSDKPDLGLGACLNDVVKKADDIRRMLSYLPETLGPTSTLLASTHFHGGLYARDKSADDMVRGEG
jgi:hypothetical protein